jgi:hypothetical protein
MKYMAKVQLQPGTKNTVMETFERIGPNRNPGVAFRGAWLGTQADVVFVLVESDDDAAVDRAIQNWNPPGQLELHPVVDVDQY